MDDTDSSNPFASPLEQTRDIGEGQTEEEAIRRQYLSHEASVQSMGLLYILGGVVCGFSSAVGLFGGLTELLSGFADVYDLMMMLLLAVVTALCGIQTWTGYGLRRLDGRVRMLASLLAGIWMFYPVIGTIIGLYSLYLLLSRKGKMVFSKEYAAIRHATPHIKYKSSIVVWILLALLVLLIFGGCLSSMFFDG